MLLTLQIPISGGSRHLKATWQGQMWWRQHAAAALAGLKTKNKKTNLENPLRTSLCGFLGKVYSTSNFLGGLPYFFVKCQVHKSPIWTSEWWSSNDSRAQMTTQVIGQMEIGMQAFPTSLYQDCLNEQDVTSRQTSKPPFMEKKKKHDKAWFVTDQHLA